MSNGHRGGRRMAKHWHAISRANFALTATGTYLRRALLPTTTTDRLSGGDTCPRKEQPFEHAPSGRNQNPSSSQHDVDWRRTLNIAILNNPHQRLPRL